MTSINKMDNTEAKWDKKMRIQTVGRDDSSEDSNHYPYEPTPYCVLERIADSGYLSKENCVVDYGSGKGRVDFFLNWKLGCSTIGVEFDEHIYNEAEENACQYQKCHKGQAQKMQFIKLGAEEYQIPEEADSFYFFNPFSVKVLRSVIGRIRESLYAFPRSMKLFFYFPSDEYVSYLMSVDELSFLDEIYCGDLFAQNREREKVLVFEIEG